MLKGFLRKHLLPWLLEDDISTAYLALEAARKPMALSEHTTNELHQFLQADAKYFLLYNLIDANRSKKPGRWYAKH